MKVIWRTVALADIGRIVAHIAKENPVAARRVAQELVVAGDSLDWFPNRGRPGVVAGTRELVAVRPYIIVYRVAHDTIRILRVWHSAQDR